MAISEYHSESESDSNVTKHHPSEEDIIVISDNETDDSSDEDIETLNVMPSEDSGSNSLSHKIGQPESHHSDHASDSYTSPQTTTDNNSNINESLTPSPTSRSTLESTTPVTDDVMSPSMPKVIQRSGNRDSEGIGGDGFESSCMRRLLEDHNRILAILDRMKADILYSSIPGSNESCMARDAQDVAEIPTCQIRSKQSLNVSPGIGNTQSLSSGKKRKSEMSRNGPAKRRLQGERVNIQARKAWLRSNDGTGSCEYSWKRGERDKNGDRRPGFWKTLIDDEQEDGEFLLLFCSDLTVEIQVNGGMRLPFKVKWNEKADAFQGTDGIDDKTMQISAPVMIDVMGGAPGSHTGLVIRRSSQRS